MTVRETRNEANSENEIVNVSGMKRSFAWPSRKTVGRNTTMVVMVDDEDRHRDLAGRVQDGRATVLAGDGRGAG